VLYIFFEPKIKHDVGFVKYCKSKTTKIKIFAFHVVLNPASSSYKNVNTTSELVSLGINVNATINGEDVVLLRIVLKHFKFFGNLERKLPSWS